MKTRFFFISVLMLLLSTTALAQGRIVGDIFNFENSKGLCVACLFNDASAFNGNTGKPVACQKVQVIKKKAQVVFTDVAAGEYAVMVFHDANGNGKMDRNFFGIPNEGYGASRNNLPFASAPGFHANKILVQKNVTVHLKIRLRNL